MKFAQILLAFVVMTFAVIVNAQTAQNCGPNEVYKTCGSACPGFCDQPNRSCNETCQEGCFCVPGFLHEIENGKNCIAFEDCPIIYGKKLIY